MIEGSATQLEQVGPWVERLGIATVLLLLGVLFTGALIWKIVPWIGRRLDRLIDAHVNMTNTFAENDNKHTAALESLSVAGKDGHATTHKKLDGLEVHLLDIKRRVPGDREGK